MLGSGSNPQRREGRELEITCTFSRRNLSRNLSRAREVNSKDARSRRRNTNDTETPASPEETGDGRWLRMKKAAKSFGLEKSRMQNLVQMSLEPGTRSNVSEEIGASREARKP